MSNPIGDLAKARVILVVGSNTTESHPVIALQIKEAVRRGARLIVCDPRRIDLVRWADPWLRLRVGTDIALFNAMAHVIVKEGLWDKAFVREKTRGLKELTRHLRSYTPERAARICGVPASRIREAARLYASAQPASIAYTLGVTEHSCGTRNVMSLANLALLTGNFGLEGGGVNPLRGQNNVQGAGDMGCLPVVLTCYQKVGDPEVRARFESAWGAPIPDTPGLNKVKVVDAILEGKVRGLYIMGENSVLSDANAAKTRDALEKAEFLVVQDMFMTDTADLADVVLPAASSAETDGTFTNTERRVQRVRAALPPPGKARPDWLIVRDLAERVGFPMPYRHPQEIWEEIRSLTPAFSGITYARIEKEGLCWPCPSEGHPGTPVLHAGDALRKRPGEFQCVDHVPLAEPPDGAYPLILTTGRRLPTYHTGTMTGRSPGLRELVPEELAEIHPDDARRLALHDGCMVRVISRRGSVEARARITDRSPRGVVFMSFHFPETPTNLLTTDACDPVTDTAEFKACAVRVEPAG
jgi:formate dehydrogenase alpha subunit